MEVRILPMEESTVQWKRPALVAGGIFVAVGLIGAAAGLWASRDIQPQASAEAPPLTLPSQAHAAVPPRADVEVATPHKAIAAPALPAPRVAKRKPQPRPAPASSPAQAAPQDQRAEDVPEIPTEQVAALASQADSAPATMPLPDSVIARTIGRIGYSCGGVASTAAVEGASGVFKVTCTSGQSYKATLVHGRYHFRRWSG
jgi:hypothetical protein